jgi:hypothetical protein
MAVSRCAYVDSTDCVDRESPITLTSHDRVSTIPCNISLTLWFMHTLRHTRHTGFKCCKPMRANFHIFFSSVQPTWLQEVCKHTSPTQTCRFSSGWGGKPCASSSLDYTSNLYGRGTSRVMWYRSILSRCWFSSRSETVEHISRAHEEKGRQRTKVPLHPP